MASIFEQTIVPKINFSNFSLNESQLLTCNFGQLIPCYCREVLPNDVFSMSAFADIQFAPMVAPMMQDVHASIHFFYVPNRIVWEDFETFITGAEDGHVISEDQLPRQAGVEITHIAHLTHQFAVQGTILDYFGLPNNLHQAAGNGDTTVISDVPIRDYFKIWYDYYRDENLQVSFLHNNTTIDYFDFWRDWKRDGLYADSNAGEAIGSAIPGMKPLYRAYRKDYFTACLPTPQKGEPVTLSLGGNAPVTFGGSITAQMANITNFIKVNENADYPLSQLGVDNAPGGGYLFGHDLDSQVTSRIIATPGDITVDTSDFTASADLSQASAITVEALREAFAVQEILESLSMRGSRFTEFLKGNFGVTPDDYRLQRPQFLGGLVTPVQVQQVIQQAGVDSEAGQMTAYAAGRAWAAAGDKIFRMRFKEHGYIIGILSVMPKAYYYQGIPRHFMRRDRFDYYMVQTAHLGEQGVENMELYYQHQSNQKDTNHAVFGFIPRWAEYKTSTNGIHGDFRGNLNYYHMARIFDAKPTLSEAFITTANVQPRPFATWTETYPNVNHLIWANLFFKVTASRPMPYHSIPKVI